MAGDEKPTQQMQQHDEEMSIPRCAKVPEDWVVPNPATTDRRLRIIALERE